MAKIIAVASGKGGVGKSSVTAGIGTALARLGKKVVLVDADIGLRSLDLILGAADHVVYDWSDVLFKRCSISDAVLKIQRQPGLSLLPAPLTFPDAFTQQEIRDTCKEITDNYECDYIIIDCPAGIGDGFYLAVGPADEILVITTPDIICVRAAHIVDFALSKINKKNSRLIINRFTSSPIEMNILPNIDDIIDLIGIQLIGIVPEDQNITFSAVKGELISEKTKAGTAFTNIAKRLEGFNIPLKYLEKM